MEILETFRSFALTRNRKYGVKQNRQTTQAPIDGVVTHYADKMMLTYRVGLRT